MKQLIILQSLLGLLFLNARAQKTTELSDLKVPVSPAFSLLDFAPKTIESPGTIKAFTTNLVTTAAKAGGIPKDFAFEFSPYWFFKHPNMDIYKYHGLMVDTIAMNKVLTGDNATEQKIFNLKQNIFYGLRLTCETENNH